MKRENKASLLLYLIEMLVLLAAVALVVHFMPDLRPGSGKDILSSSGNPSSDSDADEKETGKGGGGNQNGEDDISSESGEGGEAGESLPGGGFGDSTGSRPRHGGGGKKSDLEETQQPPVYQPPTLVVASDLHYQSPAMTDYGEAFERLVEGDDGKVLPYMDQILDAFLYEAASQNPSALILSGDLSLNGEKVNHGELARKLRAFKKNGIPVLVIPGNHDINHPWAATYYGDETVETEGIDADGFYDIYHEFGYDQAADRDENSLSYLYKLDERYWLMMLDSCQYYPQNKVNGKIRKETLVWMEKWLEEARKEQVTVIPVAHHNLLKESALYPEDCTLENSRKVIDLLEKYELPVYISGHLHLQRIKKNVNNPLSEGKYGIYEIVSNSLSIPPCQYGVLSWLEDGSIRYRTKTVDVGAWARSQGIEDENLLNFADYASEFLTDVVGTQVFRSVSAIPKDRKEEMARLYGDLNKAYCAGKKIDRIEIKERRTYFYWERYLGATKWFDRLTAILKDTGHDNNLLNLEAGIDFPEIERKEKPEETGSGIMDEDDRYVEGRG